MYLCCCIMLEAEWHKVYAAIKIYIAQAIIAKKICFDVQAFLPMST